MHSSSVIVTNVGKDPPRDRATLRLRRSRYQSMSYYGVILFTAPSFDNGTFTVNCVLGTSTLGSTWTPIISVSLPSRAFNRVQLFVAVFYYSRVQAGHDWKTRHTADKGLCRMWIDHSFIIHKGLGAVMYIHGRSHRPHL